MGKGTTLALLVLGALALGSGCHRPYYYARYPVYAPVPAPVRVPVPVVVPVPGIHRTGVALNTAGHVVLHSAHHQARSGAALAATAVGAGLHAAGTTLIRHSTPCPPPRTVTRGYRAPTAPPRHPTHRGYGR